MHNVLQYSTVVKLEIYIYIFALLLYDIFITKPFGIQTVGSTAQNFRITLKKWIRLGKRLKTVLYSTVNWYIIKRFDEKHNFLNSWHVYLCFLFALWTSLNYLNYFVYIQKRCRNRLFSRNFINIFLSKLKKQF